MLMDFTVVVHAVAIAILDREEGKKRFPAVSRLASRSIAAKLKAYQPSTVFLDDLQPGGTYDVSASLMRRATGETTQPAHAPFVV